MCARILDQGTLKVLKKNAVDLDFNEFLIDRKAAGLSSETLAWYTKKLNIFREFLAAQGRHDLADVTASDLRRFLVHLAERGHNPGGVKNIFRAVRAWLRWYGAEHAPQGWDNPLRKLKTPRTAEPPLEPVSLEVVKAMLTTCDKTFAGERDRAIILALLDTGCRASEFCAIDLADLNLATGAVILRGETTKSRRQRGVFLGAKTLRQTARYLRLRRDKCPALWVTEQGTRLTYSGLRQIIRRRAERAGVKEPSLHSFRRAFALLSLRNGCDVYSLQKLMGHADLSVLRRYLAQTEADLKAAHERSGPVDNLL